MDFIKSAHRNLHLGEPSKRPRYADNSIGDHSDILKHGNNTTCADARACLRSDTSKVNYGNGSKIKKQHSKGVDHSSTSIGAYHIFRHFLGSKFSSAVFTFFIVESSDNAKSRKTFSHDLVLHIHVLIRFIPHIVKRAHKDKYQNKNWRDRQHKYCGQHGIS